ncbi:MAG: type II toxin-antitoxin system VapC family toxin [Chloroflexi bacterium]|nr:type II toxin-antitoxin system VapC family toxin [Chloroflexota bacterium]
MSASGKLVVDASVAVKWYVPEVGTAEATAILNGGDSLLAPDLLVAEFGNVIWKKVRRGELSPSEASDVADAFVAACPLALRPASAFLRPALDIATRWQRTVYDALYLAVALAEGCPLITGDDRLVRALSSTELAKVVRPLLAVER